MGSGDSYSATGFNVSGAWPTSATPFGNPARKLPSTKDCNRIKCEVMRSSANLIIAGAGTFSGGWNWLHYLAMKYNTSQTFVFDLAYGGATTDDTIASERNNIIISTTKQVTTEFIPKLAKGPWVGKPTTFSILSGINE